MTIAMRDETWQLIDQTLYRHLPEAQQKLATFIQEVVAQKKPEWIQVGEAQDKLEGRIEEAQTLLPKTVIQQVQATKDLEQLEQWSMQILFITELEEMGFVAEPAT